MTASIIPINHYPQMTQLAQQFPTLRRAEGLVPFDPEKLDRWACTTASHGGLFAARFVLSVWSGRGARYKYTKRLKDKQGEVYAHLFRVETPWRAGPFDAVDAMGTWDAAHREAFLSWVRDPWWP